MTALLKERPDIAPKVCAKGKTLKGAYQALYEYAKKNHGSSACYPIGTVLGTSILAEYYGFSEAAPTSAHSDPQTSAEPDDLLSLLEDL